MEGYGGHLEGDIRDIEGILFIINGGGTTFDYQYVRACGGYLSDLRYLGYPSLLLLCLTIMVVII